MAIEKQILSAVPELQEEIDIEILPEMEEETEVFIQPDGSAIIGSDMPDQASLKFGENLADVLDENELNTISSELVASYEDDVESRQDWYDTYVDGLDLLGINAESRSQPFEGASGVHHPILAEAVTQFQAQAYKELLPAGGPVDTEILGMSDDQKIEKANRVKNFMNYQITYKMEEYDSEMDQLLFYLPLSGSAFKKVYYDPAVGRAVSRFVKAEHLVVPYYAVDLLTSPRITHVIHMNENELRKLQLSGFYKDVDMMNPGADTETTKVDDKIEELQGINRTIQDEEYTLLEMHVNLDLEGYKDTDENGEETGLALPYIVTICKDNDKILAIRPNFKEEDPMKKKVEYFTHYKFLPGLGFYGFGLIHMMGGLTKSVTAILRQLIDAGTLANLPAGFKSRGLNIQRSSDPLQPGEWRDVDAPGGRLQDAFLPLPYKEPSGTLTQLLGALVDSGKQFAATVENPTGDGNTEAPVGTTVALLEKGQRVMSAIHKRLHYAQRCEFKILKRVFGEFLPPEYPYQVQGASSNVFKDDFDTSVDVLPVSDPNIFSMTQRITLAQTQLQMAQAAPDLHDLRAAYRKMYIALNVKDIDSILPPEEEVQPKDPILENMDSLLQTPLQAFPQQNHEAHIAAHTAFLENPKTAQNPAAVAALQAHIQQHNALKYRVEIEALLAQQGVQLPPPGQPIPPEVESQIAIAAAQATQTITGQEQALANAMQTPDPQREMFEQQLQLEREQLMQKEQADARDTQVAMTKAEMDAQIKREKIQADVNKENTKSAIELQELELKAKSEQDKNYRESLNTIRNNRN
jgi:LmbE family N-acetylglucosaminyl deacetylase